MKKKINFGTLFYNNKFTILFSLATSFIIWIVVSASSYEKQEKVVSDIPITIALSDNSKEDGLRVFSGADIRAEVTVSGNRVSLGMISKDNIQVIAKQAINSITSPGKYTLELTANKKGTLTDYEFSSPVTPNFITVSVDRLREITLTIENEVKYSSDPSYLAASPNFSDQTVTISGPEAKITTISRAVVKKDIDGILKTTKNEKIPLTLYDSYGSEISKEQLNMSAVEINVTIPILFRKVLNIIPDLTGIPNGLDVNSLFSTVEPSSMEIAGPEETVKDLSHIKLMPVDISKINLDHKIFDLDVNLPSGCKAMNNNYSAKLKINMDQMKSITINVSKISFINIPEGKSPTAYTNNISVEMIGPSNKILSLDSNDIIAEIDLKDQQSYTGRKEFPVKIRTNTTSSCWAFGNYTANIGIE